MDGKGNVGSKLLVRTLGVPYAKYSSKDFRPFIG